MRLLAAPGQGDMGWGTKSIYSQREGSLSIQVGLNAGNASFPEGRRRAMGGLDLFKGSLRLVVAGSERANRFL